MSREKSAIADELSLRIQSGAFAVSLSGGGHRATLATLGALMALVDRGLASRILQVASVSGGSITNAFVAQRARLEKLKPGELDGIAKDLCSVVVHEGVLTMSWIVRIVVLSLSVGGLAAFLVLRFTSSMLLASALGIIVALAAFLGRGLLVEWLLDRRYFQRGQGGGPSAAGPLRKRLAALSGGAIDHVFCMTDLVLGLPVYASSQHGGFIYRRLVPERDGREYRNFQTFNARDIPLATIVRASAAFPGIPPVRMNIPRDSKIEMVGTLPSTALLSDGGVWNNLGSQVLREDDFLGSYASWDDGVLRPFGPAPNNIPLLCVNGSAPLTPSSPWMYAIPGLALLRTLLQVTEILNANTVFPRVEAIRRAFNRRIGCMQRPSINDPADLIVDLGPIPETEERYQTAAVDEEDIRLSDGNVKAWERSAIGNLRFARDKRSSSPDADRLGHVLREPEPPGSYPACGFANGEDWDNL